MKRWNLTFSKLTRAHVESFLCYPEENKVQPCTSSAYRGELIPYLKWLWDEGYLRFDPQPLQKRTLYPLPPSAKHFVRYLEATLKKNTCRGYESSLRNFYQWLEAEGLSLDELTRSHITHWIQYLGENKRSASVRAARIVHIRIYFYWLNEQGILSAAFNRLIRPTDIPRLPEYLPRPLPPNTDRKLIARLENSSCIYQQGLLLMRRTGIRIGELISLEQNCIRVDPNGNAFLKVPLGKLDNERLVPLDDKALRVAKKLQKQGPSGAKTYLLEQDTKKRKTHYALYAKALVLATNGLETDGRITTHRLRHTYATTLLNGGMSLVGLMKLMGHRSYRMTLRYAAVTGETINEEYFKALEKIQTKYDTPYDYQSPSLKTDPVQMLSDVIRCIQNRTLATDKSQNIKPLIKRIQRIQSTLANLNI
jgi:site-specific recombinase XerD